jgi:hypothetical protein
MNAVGWAMYFVGVGSLLYAHWLVMRARHHARLAKIDLEGAERMFNLSVQQAKDMAALVAEQTDRYLELRGKMDAQLHRELCKFFGMDVAEHGESKPS